jgi:sirohydrochlorin cobaltochelatase
MRAEDASPESAAPSAVVLVGHGAVPSDIPRALVQRLRALEAERRRDGGSPGAEERELDAKVRAWPRTAQTDPYKAGIDAIAAGLRSRLGRVVVAFNEFCAPSLDEAVEALAREGVKRIVVVTTMLTPGGVHAEVEIPEAIGALSAGLPDVEIRYAWPFDTDAVAALLAEACRTAAPLSPRSRKH